MTEHEADEGSVEIDKLLAELENETLPEASDIPKKPTKPVDKKDEIYSVKDDEDQTEENTW